MKVRYLLFVGLLLSSFAAFSQIADGGLVAGKVQAAVTGQPLAKVQLSIVDEVNQNIISTVYSTTKGDFQFVNLPAGNFNMIIKLQGFDKEIIEDIELDDDHTYFNTGIIKLKKVSVLGEIVIAEKKRTVTFDADQITYNVASSLQASGSTAGDLLKNVPMVTTNVGGGIAIAGKRNTRIFIDGEPSDYMTANISDLLSVLPSDAIEKIEVMLNPPAKYSADGDGIINITLKKDYKSGLNATASINAGTLGNYNASTFFTYKLKKLSFTGGYGFNENYAVSHADFDQDFISANSFSRDQGIDNRYRNFGHNLNESINYALPNDQTLTLSSNYNFNRTIGSSATNFTSFNTDHIQNGANGQLNDIHSHAFNYGLNLNYVWKIDKNGERLDVGLGISGYNNPYDSFFILNYKTALGLAIPGRLPYEQSQRIGNGYKGKMARVDYEKPIGKSKSVFGYGLLADVRSNNSDQDVETVNAKTNVQQQVPSQSNNFVYNQSIYAGYASTTLRTDNNWAFRLGARAELASTDYTLQVVKQPLAKATVNPYLRVFPNVSVTKRIKSKYTLGLSYSERIARANTTALSPVAPSPDSNTVSFRNLNILPAYTQQVDLSFGVYNEKWSFYPRLSYAYTNNTIENIILVDNLGRGQYTYDNLGPSTYNTLNLYGDYRPGHNLIINGGTTIGEIFYQKSKYVPNNRTAYSFYYKLGMTLSLPKSIAFEGNLSYNANAFAQVNNTSSAMTSVAVRKAFYKNKLKLRLMAINPIGQTTYHVTTRGANFLWENATGVNAHNFTAALSYVFSSDNKQIGKH